MPSTVFALSIIVSFIVGIIASYVLFKLVFVKRYLEEGRRISRLEHGDSMNAQIKTGIREHKDTEEFKALLEVEYRKGVEEGEKKALGDFGLSYEPYVEVTDTFLKRTADIGYMMQMFYKGLPIGDPMKRITSHEEKFKEDNLKYLIDTVTGTLNNIMHMAAPLGIPVKVSQNPKIEKKK